MRMRAIRVGMWVETTIGDGQVRRAGGTIPPSVAVDIVRPVPRGVCNLKPGDVKREIEVFG